MAAIKLIINCAGGGGGGEGGGGDRGGVTPSPSCTDSLPLSRKRGLRLDDITFTLKLAYNVRV
jgi:hypothetical protein